MKHIKVIYILLVTALIAVSLFIFIVILSHGLRDNSNIKYIVTTKDTYDYVKGFEIRDMAVTNENDIYIMYFPYGILKADLNTFTWKPIEDTLEIGRYTFLLPLDKEDLFAVNQWHRTKTQCSSDGGKSWENGYVFRFIDAVYTDKEKSIWMVDKNMELFLSQDKGYTWSYKSIYKTEEEAEKQRATDVYFDKEDNSIWISTQKNSILCSVDTGDTYMTITTPADQIVNSNKDMEFSAIYKTRAIGKYYYTMQYDYVYKSPKDNIDWRTVKNMSWFEKTKDFGMIAIVDDSIIVKTKADGKTEWKQEFSASKYGQVYHKKLANNDLWCITSMGFLCRISRNGVQVFDMHLDPNFKKEYESQLRINANDTVYNDVEYYNGVYYAIRYNAVYYREKNSDTIFRYLRTPQYIMNIWKDSDGVYICAGENKYQINKELDGIKQYNSDFSDLMNKQIDSLIFEKYISDCFYWHIEKLRYCLKDGYFIKGEIENDISHWDNEKSKLYLYRMPDSISERSVKEMLKTIYRAMDGFQDTIHFDITEEERSLYKQKINGDVKRFTEETEDNFFFGKTEKVVWATSALDTIKNFSQQTLQKVLTDYSYKYAGTKSKHHTVTLKMNDGSVLTLSNYYFFPNYLLNPWTANYKNELFFLNSLAVGKKIDNVTNGIFLSGYNSNWYALKNILDYHYRLYYIR